MFKGNRDKTRRFQILSRTNMQTKSPTLHPGKILIGEKARWDRFFRDWASISPVLQSIVYCKESLLTTSRSTMTTTNKNKKISELVVSH